MVQYQEHAFLKKNEFMSEKPSYFVVRKVEIMFMLTGEQIFRKFTQHDILMALI